MRGLHHLVVTWATSHRVDLALAAVVLAMAAPLVQMLGAQQASRLALTAAVWDDGSIRIDDYPLGIDRATREGRTYSDKAPGQPYAAVPAYAAYRLLGGEPARVERTMGNLGLWVTTVWSSAVPAAALAVMVRRAARRVNPRAATSVALAISLSTMVLPFSTVLFGHVLSAALAFAGWLLVTRRGLTSRQALLAGAALGSAVAVEYTIAIGVVVIGAFVAHSVRVRLIPFCLGGVIPASLLMLYQWAAFGHPLRLSYGSSAFHAQAEAIGLEPVGNGPLENGLGVILGERGLLVISPIVAMAILGTVALIRSSAGLPRRGYLAAAACAAALVTVQVFWDNPTGGDSPGPRYATAAAVFLAPGLAVAWGRWRRACVATAIIGALFMVAATYTNPLEARDSSNAIGIWLDKFLHGEWALSIYEMMFGSVLAHALMVLVPACALGMLWRLDRGLSPGEAKPNVTPRRAARAGGP